MHGGYYESAALLVAKAQEVRDCTTNQAAKVVDLLTNAGGWGRPEILDCSTFDPLTDRSPHPTIVQLAAGPFHENVHVVAFADDYVFNSNWMEKRQITRETLDACCPGVSTFAHASYAARLHPGNKLRKRARAAVAAAEERAGEEKRARM